MAESAGNRPTLTTEVLFVIASCGNSPVPEGKGAGEGGGSWRIRLEKGDRGGEADTEERNERKGEERTEQGSRKETDTERGEMEERIGVEAEPRTESRPKPRGRERVRACGRTRRPGTHETVL